MMIFMVFITFSTYFGVSNLLSVNFNEFDVYESKRTNLFRFWTSVGFSPTTGEGMLISDFLLSNDEQQNLAYIGAIPNNGVTHVRVHWLLNLITIQEKNILRMNFTNLDRFLQLLDVNGLKPGFELMGNPSEYFYNITTQIDDWKLLIENIIIRYLGDYEINSWRFETWNEPDLKMYNTLNMTLNGYFMYLKATTEILNQYNLTIWGPAGLFKTKKNHPFCWSAINYCGSHRKCPFDAISFHKKGNEVASHVVLESMSLINDIQGKYSNLANITFVNDEADPLSGWWRPKIWRSNVQYASALIQIVIGFMDKKSVSAISNDNGFLSYAPYETQQRTLLTRCNDTDDNVYFVKKPVYLGLVLLSLLGDTIVQKEYKPDENFAYVISATDSERRYVGLFAFGNDNLTDSHLYEGYNNLVTLFIPSGFKGFIYQINNYENKGCTFTNQHYHQCHQFIPWSRKIIKSRNTTSIFRLNITNTSVIAINLCRKKYSEKPGPVVDLRFLPISKGKILLIWSDRQLRTKCINGYIIEYKSQSKNTFVQLPDQLIKDLSTIYQFDGCLNCPNCTERVSISGQYRVQVVDFWNRRGLYSNILTVP